MSEETWRPLGVESDDEVAEYDALHDGVPRWMAAAFWAWVRKNITKTRYNNRYGAHLDFLNETQVEEMAQVLKVPLPNLRVDSREKSAGENQLNAAMKHLRDHPQPLQIADYILANFESTDPDELEAVLVRSKSAWTVGNRSGRQGLVRRVPTGVQVGADSVMQRAGRAGARLAKAWEELYGPNPNPSEAYRLAILAVEDAAIPVVSPSNKTATLGTVLKQMADQTSWQLPMTREHDGAPSTEVVLGMIRLLWHGQHDRHGGQPSAPGNVSFEEATVAVGLATTLVQFFSAGLVARGE